MPVVRNVLPYRKSRRLRQAAPKMSEDDDLWEAYDEILAATQSDAPSAVAALPDDTHQPSQQLDNFVSSPPAAKEPAHIPRPRNAFICFRSVYVRLQRDGSVRPRTLDQTVMSRGAGDVWQSMSTSERLPYVRMAQEEKKAHTLKYPDYRYSPGNGGLRNARKPKLRAVVSRRASSVSSDGSGITRTSISRRGSSHDYEPYAPAPRRAARKKALASSRRRRTSSTSTAEGPAVDALPPAVPAPDIVEEVEEEVPVEVPARGSEDNEPTVDTVVEPRFSPEAIPLAKDGEDLEPPIQRTLVQPSSWDRVPAQFGFKEGILPTLIDSLTLAAPVSPPSSPVLITDTPELYPTGYDNSSPAVSQPAPQPWNADMYFPLEMHDDTLEIQFGQIPDDFGFFHPWDFDDSTPNNTL
ncbi:hypothetical protein C8J57DRAFT_679047 [Mycena rebaudengoi]|nr:hypothetical protein C8J57DRAFT_679047 [Mycena rebaudengoi]